MNAKLFEIRDSGTLIPVLAVLMESEHDQESWLLRHAGYGPDSGLVLMAGLVAHPDKATYSPYDWGNNRSRFVAHQYITENWHNLTTGAVIDVEFILGEKDVPKVSEREPDANMSDGNPADYGDRG